MTRAQSWRISAVDLVDVLVYLGGFIPVTLSILALMASRALVRVLLGPEGRTTASAG